MRVREKTHITINNEWRTKTLHQQTQKRWKPKTPTTPFPHLFFFYFLLFFCCFHFLHQHPESESLKISGFSVYLYMCDWLINWLIYWLVACWVRSSPGEAISTTTTNERYWFISIIVANGCAVFSAASPAAEGVFCSALQIHVASSLDRQSRCWRSFLVPSFWSL